MSIARLISSREMLLDDRCTGDFLIQIDQVFVKAGELAGVQCTRNRRMPIPRYVVVDGSSLG